VGLSENKSKTKTLLFIKILKKNISLPIITTDETLTTQEAKIKLLSAKKKKRNGKIDHYESCLILQNYLDSHQD